jgi:hypothetical protein
MSNIIKKVGFSLFVALLLSACAPKIIPIKSKNVRIKEDFALIHQKEYDIAIQPQSWNDAPQNLENYFTVFFLIFRNKSKEVMKIEKDSFVLLDEQGEQYRLYDGDEVVKIMYGNEQFYDASYLLNFDSKDKEEMKEELKERLQGMRNIKLKAFQFRNIRTQAQESGYIFFEKIQIKKNSFFKIYYNDDAVEFAITG